MEMQLLFLPLFHGYHPGVGGGNGVESGVEGRLVKSWERTPDNRTWTYHLRTDVRWHDGVPVTAGDIEFTWALWEHPAILKAAPGAQTLTVLNDSTFTVTFHTGGWPDDTYNTFLPRHLLKHLDPEEIDAWEFWEHPIGNGPYRYVRHEPGIFVELEANPDYYRGRPEVRRVILRLLRPAQATGFIDLSSGDADWANFRGSPLTADLLAQNPQFRAIYDVGTSAMVIVWNQNNPLFSDGRVRQALTIGLDRRELARTEGIPDDLPIFDLTITGNQRTNGENPGFLPFDPDRARRLLAEAGWTDGDGDGWVDRNGVPFRFEILPAYDSDLLILVQDQYRRLGIQMEITPIAQDAMRGRYDAGDFDAAFRGSSGIADVYQKDEDPVPIGYGDPELLRLANELYNSENPDRDDIQRRYWALARKDFFITGLFPSAEILVVHRRLGSPDDLFDPTHVDEMWIDEDWDKVTPDGEGGGS
jgi:peptide/nickel transport system substrate-binding protein